MHSTVTNATGNKCVNKHAQCDDVVDVILSDRNAVQGVEGSDPKRREPMQYYVYILANATNVALYIGVTSNLRQRVYQHKNHMDPDSFTAKYNIHKLVYFEETTDVRAALEREKQLKGWRRSKKNALIETANPNWNDLYPMILREETDSSTPLRCTQGRSE